jgi:hypothetical protein
MKAKGQQQQTLGAIIAGSGPQAVSAGSAPRTLWYRRPGSGSGGPATGAQASAQAGPTGQGSLSPSKGALAPLTVTVSDGAVITTTAAFAQPHAGASSGSPTMPPAGGTATGAPLAGGSGGAAGGGSSGAPSRASTVTLDVLTAPPRRLELEPVARAGPAVPVHRAVPARGNSGEGACPHSPAHAILPPPLHALVCSYAQVCRRTYGPCARRGRRCFAESPRGAVRWWRTRRGVRGTYGGQCCRTHTSQFRSQCTPF